MSLTTSETPPAAVENFPIDSFRDAARELRRPFTTNAVKFKPQAKVPKNNPTRTLCVAYIDARLVVERLNLVVPHLWHDEYEPLGKHLICRLTVDGITRQDVGEGTGKALYSDALKRAAVKFGIGVSLYAVPQQWINEPVDYLSDAHVRTFRAAYGGWLDRAGRQAFGEPLDHGDVEGAQGDADAPTVDPQTGEVLEAPRRAESPGQALKDLCVEAVEAGGMSGSDITRLLLNHGAELKQTIREAIEAMTPENQQAAHGVLRDRLADTLATEAGRNA
jgi:hypothetical protein